MMKHQGLCKVKEYLLQPIEVMHPSQLILSQKQHQQRDIQERQRNYFLHLPALRTIVTKCNSFGFDGCTA